MAWYFLILAGDYVITTGDYIIAGGDFIISGGDYRKVAEATRNIRRINNLLMRSPRQIYSYPLPCG